MRTSSRLRESEQSESIEFVPKRELDRVEQKNERLRQENEPLKREAERLRRNWKRPFGPPSPSRAALARRTKTQAEAPRAQAGFGRRPLLLETLVDGARFRGICYRAANWIHVGQTVGRGRMDREHTAHGRAVKDIYVYPLLHDAQQRLCGDLTR